MPKSISSDTSVHSVLRRIANSRQIARLALVVVLLLGGLWGIRTASAYFVVERAALQVNKWLSGEQVPNRERLEQIQNQLEEATRALPRDTNALVTLAKLYFIRGQHSTSQQYYDTALATLARAHRWQPSYFSPLALQVLVHAYSGSNKSQMMAKLNQVLQLAPYEKQVQEWLGPVVVQYWHQLPAEIQQQAIPMITGALREPSTREILLAAMARYKVVSPFTCCSPNRETSARLRMLEAQAVNETDQ